MKAFTGDRNILMERVEFIRFLCAKIVEHNLRVIHHCQLSGKIFEVSHSNCNFCAKTPRFFPAFFHILSRYDADHIIKISKLNAGEKLSAIAKNDETYISFYLDIPIERFKSKLGQNVVLYPSLRFLDSFQIMSESLDSLANTVEKIDFRLLRVFSPKRLGCSFREVDSKFFFSRTNVSTLLKSLLSPFHCMGFYATTL